MNKFIFIILFFLVSCSHKPIKNNIIFNVDMDFEEFRNKLEKYSENNPYPNIDN